MPADSRVRRPRAADLRSITHDVARADASRHGGVAAHLMAIDRPRWPIASKEITGCGSALKSGGSGRPRAGRKIVANGLAPAVGGTEARASSPIWQITGGTGTGAPQTPSTAPPIGYDCGCPSRPEYGRLLPTAHGSPSFLAAEWGER